VNKVKPVVHNSGSISFDFDPAKVDEIQYYLDDEWHVYEDLLM